MDAERGVVDESRLSQLRRRGGGTGEKRAGSDRHNDVIRQPPVELLGALEQDRLRSLRVVRAQREVDEAPAFLIGEARAEPVDLVVRTEHADHGGAVRGRAGDLSFVGRRGHKDERAEPIARRRGGDRAREVAGRCAGDRVEPELEGASERDGDRPVLERERGIARVVLDEEIRDTDRCAESRRADERSPADREMRRRLGQRKEIRVSPQRVGASRDFLAKRVRVGRREVVLRFDRSVALRADVSGIRGLQDLTRPAAQATKWRDPFQRDRHRSTSRQLTREASLSGGLSVLLANPAVRLASRTRIRPGNPGHGHGGGERSAHREEARNGRRHGQTGQCTLHRDYRLFTLRRRGAGRRLARLAGGEISYALARSLRASRVRRVHVVAGCARCGRNARAGAQPGADPSRYRVTRRGADRPSALGCRAYRERSSAPERGVAAERDANPEPCAHPCGTGTPALHDPHRHPQRGTDPSAGAACFDEPSDPAAGRASDPWPLVVVFGRVP